MPAPSSLLRGVEYWPGPSAQTLTERHSVVMAGLVPWAFSPRTRSVGIHELPRSFRGCPAQEPVLGPRKSADPGPGMTA
jgi:hypothetical protein